MNPVILHDLEEVLDAVLKKSRSTSILRELITIICGISWQLLEGDPEPESNLATL
jgi:hypothetical protein